MNELKFWLLKYNSGIHGSREVRIFSHLSGRWTQAVGSWCPRHSQGLLSWITQCIKKTPKLKGESYNCCGLAWIDNVHGLCRVWEFTYWVKPMSVSNITMWAKPCKLSFYLGNSHRCFTEWGRWGLDRKAALRNLAWSHRSALRSPCFRIQGAGVLFAAG